MWLKVDSHPCWRVQRELDAAGIKYGIVPGPVRRSKRDELEKLSGQRLYPVIEGPDGRIYREESNDMAERIRAGTLFGALVHSHAVNDTHDHAHEPHAIDTESM